jgi:hypothetical protein
VTTGVARILKYTITSGFTIGGTVVGLATGKSITLRNNGTDALLVPGNGNFTFANTLASGATYAIAIATQPADQTCTVNAGSGTANTNITNVAITCSIPTFAISVTGKI